MTIIHFSLHRESCVSWNKMPNPLKVLAAKIPLYAVGRDFDYCQWVFELQALDKHCQHDIEMLHQETSYSMYPQITPTIDQRRARY